MLRPVLQEVLDRFNPFKESFTIKRWASRKLQKFDLHNPIVLRRQGRQCQISCLPTFVDKKKGFIQCCYHLHEFFSRNYFIAPHNEFKEVRLMSSKAVDAICMALQVGCKYCFGDSFLTKRGSLQEIQEGKLTILSDMELRNLVK